MIGKTYTSIIKNRRRLNSMKIAIIQLNIEWEDKEANLKKAKEFITQAKKDECDLIVFPEMFNSGFSMNTSKTSEDISGPTISELRKKALENKISIVAGLCLKDTSLAKNIGVYINDKGELISQYTKNHPFSFSGEHNYFQSGSDQVIFNINNLKASLFVCYDLRFPEIFRKVAKEVGIIFVIANWPESRKDHWETLIKARAIENQCYILGVNRLGSDGNNLKYHGGSMLVDPWGKIISGPEYSKEYFTVKINQERVREIREKYPFLKDMKI